MDNNILDINLRKFTDKIERLHIKRKEMILAETEKQQGEIREAQYEIVKGIAKDVKLSVEQMLELRSILNQNVEYNTAMEHYGDGALSPNIHIRQFIGIDYLPNKIFPIVFEEKSRYILKNCNEFIRQAQNSDDQSNLQDLRNLRELEAEYRNFSRSKVIKNFNVPSVEEVLSSNPDYIDLVEHIRLLEKIVILIGNEIYPSLNGHKDASTQTDFELQDMIEGLPSKSIN